MSANIVNVNVTDEVISLDLESDSFIGGRAFNLHALPDDFQVNDSSELTLILTGTHRNSLTVAYRNKNKDQP